MNTNTILVIGSTGKTGKRVATRLTDLGIDVRHGSRSSATPFDWDQPSTWAPALHGATAAYVTYSPDLAVPGSVDAITELVALARAAGVRRLVLLSGRGEEEAKRAEDVVRASGLEWTIVRATWFAQNFSEGNFADELPQAPWRFRSATSLSRSSTSTTSPTSPWRRSPMTGTSARRTN